MSSFRCVLAVAVAVGVLAASARAEEKEGDKDGAKVAVKDLPQAVVDAVKAAYPTAVITEAEKETEDGKVEYTVEIKAGEKELDLEVSADGKSLKVESEGVAVKDLPQAVVDAVKAAYPAGVIKEAEKETEDGQTRYSVEVKVGDKVFDVKVSADGKTLKAEDDGEKVGKDNEKEGDNNDAEDDD